MSKKIWIAIAVVAAIIVAYFLMSGGPGYIVNNEQPNISSNSNPNHSSSPTVKTTAKKSTIAAMPGSYSELVKQYEERRIQFDERCQATPPMPVYKNGTSILLDNRSGSPRVIKIGNMSYSLVGYGYRVVTLTSSSLPQEFSVSCGSSNNVSKILLQARISQ